MIGSDRRILTGCCAEVCRNSGNVATRSENVGPRSRGFHAYTILSPASASQTVQTLCGVTPVKDHEKVGTHPIPRGIRKEMISQELIVVHTRRDVVGVR